MLKLLLIHMDHFSPEILNKIIYSFQAVMILPADSPPVFSSFRAMYTFWQEQRGR